MFIYMNKSYSDGSLLRSAQNIWSEEKIVWRTSNPWKGEGLDGSEEEVDFITKKWTNTFNIYLSFSLQSVWLIHTDTADLLGKPGNNVHSGCEAGFDTGLFKY